MARSLGRSLMLVFFSFAMAGFGICALCGGVMGINTQIEHRAGTPDFAWLIFGLSGLGALLAWGSWRGIQALRRPPAE